MRAKRIKSEKRVIEKIELTPNFAEVSKEWVERHQRKLIGVGVCLFVILAGIWGFNAYTSSKEKRAREEYSKIVQNWADSEASPPQSLEHIAAQLEKYVTEYGSTPASRNALLDLGKAHYQMRRYEDAMKWNSQALEQARSDRSMKSLARYQLALTYEALGKADDALNQWMSLQTESDKGFAREVEWWVAKSYARKGDYSKAVEHFEKALKTEGNYPGEPLMQSELAHAKSMSGSGGGSPKSELKGAGQ